MAASRKNNYAQKGENVRDARLNLAVCGPDKKRWERAAKKVPRRSLTDCVIDVMNEWAEKELKDDKGD